MLSISCHFANKQDGMQNPSNCLLETGEQMWVCFLSPFRFELMHVWCIQQKVQADNVFLRHKSEV